MDPETEIAQPVAEKLMDEADEKSGGMYQVWMLAISLSILQIGFGIVTPIFPWGLRPSWINNEKEKGGGPNRG